MIKDPKLFKSELKNMCLFDIHKNVRWKSFRGGVHPPGKKEFSRAAPIEILPPPGKVVLPLLQHVGQPCHPIANPRQKVVYGEKIGQGKAFISASLHTPVSGVVQRMKTITLPNGRHLPAMIVKTEGEQIPGEDLYADIIGGDWSKDCMKLYEPRTVHEAIHEVGIVGLGGPRFPPTSRSPMRGKNRCIP